MSEMVTFVPSTRGGKIVVNMQFMYKIDKRVNNISYWKCATNNGCKARLILANDLFKEKSGTHTHVADPKVVQAKIFHNKLKKRAQDELTTAVPKIYREELAQTAVSMEAASVLPCYSTMSKTMYRARSQLRPHLPKSLDDLQVNGVWSKTQQNKQFLLVDDGEGANRMLVQHLGLSQMYRNDEEVWRWIRRLAALPLVPQDQVSHIFSWIRTNSPDLPQTATFHDYMNNTWLNESNALFTCDIWNHFENDSERTNNHLEGWHSRMRKKAVSIHLNIFSFVELLKQEQAENEALMRMLECGRESPPQQKAKYRRINERLSILKEKLRTHEITAYVYIDSVSYFIQLED